MPSEQVQTIEHLYADHVRALERAYGEALAEAGYDAVVVHSGTPKKRSIFDDQYYPHRATPKFQRWVPLGEPGCFLLVEPGAETQLLWPDIHDFWERPPAPESLAFLDVLAVRRTGDLAGHLPRGKRVAWIGEDVAAAEGAGLGAHANPEDLMRRLDAHRVRKTPYEVACLAEANRRAGLGHEAVRHAFAEDDFSELELHLLFLNATRQDDQDTPYKNIVALGANAATLHHIAYGRDTTRAESLLLDAGASCLGYGSDVTRTWVKPRGSASEVFATLLAQMEAMQQRLCAAVQVGMPYEDLHDESHRQVSAILKEIGIATGSVEEIDGRGISRVFYPHGLGHSLGLQTHDVGCALVKPRPENLFLRNTAPIEEGQTFTIEPGLYFIEPLLAELRTKPEAKLVDWQLVEALAPLGGIRIEDDVLVQSAGIRNLTREVLPLGGGELSAGPSMTSQNT